MVSLVSFLGICGCRKPWKPLPSTYKHTDSEIEEEIVLNSIQKELYYSQVEPTFQKVFCKLNKLLPTWCKWVAVNPLALTHWGRNKITTISQTTFSNAFSLKFVPKVSINNITALVQIMAWRRPGDKPLSESMMISLLTHMCITQPQWVKQCLRDWEASKQPMGFFIYWWVCLLTLITLYDVILPWRI